MAGESFDLRCKATGSPLPTIIWLFNDSPVDGLNNVYARGEVLTIRDARSELSGYFTCRAVSPAGQYAQDTAFVRVTEPEREQEPPPRPEYPGEQSSNDELQAEINPRQASASVGETIRLQCIVRNPSSGLNYRYTWNKQNEDLPEQVCFSW